MAEGHCSNRLARVARARSAATCAWNDGESESDVERPGDCLGSMRLSLVLGLHPTARDGHRHGATTIVDAHESILGHQRVRH